MSKLCWVCGEEYTPRTNSHFCGPKCSAEWRRCTVRSTASQYKHISGNWPRYFARLCAKRERRGAINAQDCMAILERQGGRCALSGVEMTCILKRGVSTRTNASLDRIDPGRGYEPANVQLVCAVLNSFRNSTPLEEFKDWCRKVAAYGEKAPQL